MEKTGSEGGTGIDDQRGSSLLMGRKRLPYPTNPEMDRRARLVPVVPGRVGREWGYLSGLYLRRVPLITIESILVFRWASLALRHPRPVIVLCKILHRYTRQLSISSGDAVLCLAGMELASMSAVEGNNTWESTSAGTNGTSGLGTAGEIRPLGAQAQAAIDWPV